MKYDFDDLYEGPRSEQRSKRRKTNLILNSLIGIVVVLIIVAGSIIFLGNDDNEIAKPASGEIDTTEENEKEDSTSEVTEDNNESTTDEESAVEESKNEATKGQTATEENDSNNEDVTVIENSEDPLVKAEILNPNWKPVGTTQTGEHVAVYDESSQDWKEMKQALSYASGLNEEALIVWYLGNNGSHNKAIGTITSKDQQQIYRIQLEWVDGQGWKPVKLEELNENPHATNSEQQPSDEADGE